ncbi:hypothetical protein EMPS_08599 [Entomortierella parvispora]|uniref:Uncharacterized protein n=1 Tax=Entomortierella parvispora TaxID=205924 RepID=A0A9P3LZS6_9FUNG|nr:hypothetical protein EMPS_08599 [Entomortierella parvispora]
MSIKSYILETYLFKRLFSISIWLLILGIPLLIISTILYCAAKGTGNVAGLVVDKAAKRVRSYQQEQRKKEKMEPPVDSVHV